MEPLRPVSERDPPLACVTGMQRSGTTWLNRMIADALNAPSLTRDHTWDRVEVAENDPVVYGLDRHGRGVRRGHWTAEQYPYPESPVVVIVRDIRDQTLSSCHYHQQKDFNAHARWVAGTNCENWRKFVMGWSGYGAPIVRYEDLRTDTLRVLKTTLQLLELDLPGDERLAGVVHDNNFEVMQKEGRAHKLMRRGMVGEGLSGLMPQTRLRLEYTCADVMRFLGYDSRRDVNER